MILHSSEIPSPSFLWKSFPRWSKLHISWRGKSHHFNDRNPYNGYINPLRNWVDEFWSQNYNTGSGLTLAHVGKMRGKWMNYWVVSKNMFPPKWMVKIMENPIKIRMTWGEHPLFLDTTKWSSVCFICSSPRNFAQSWKKNECTLFQLIGIHFPPSLRGFFKGTKNHWTP